MSINYKQINISTTQFSNYVTKEPEKQLTEVRKIKKQHNDEYSIPPDLYKQFRDRVARMHKRRESKNVLDELVNSQTESARQVHYPILVDGYKKFIG